jgi:hypothetical protein
LVLDELLLADLDALVGDEPVHVLADWLHIFRLIVGLFDHFGIGSKTLEGALESFLLDTGGLSGWPQSLDASLVAVGEGLHRKCEKR